MPGKYLSKEQIMALKKRAIAAGIVAELVTEGQTNHPIAPFRIDRVPKADQVPEVGVEGYISNVPSNLEINNQ